jgi:signal recognition particle receptor subunit beta
MAGFRAGEVDARVVYWGIEGCGKTTNLEAVHARLRPDHRSAIRHEPTRFDPTASYEVLPIELGEIAGIRTRLQIVSAPSGDEHAPTRKQLLDEVDGVVLVLDSQPERRDENLASYEELRRALSAYGRSLDAIPLVVQYNKRDLGDPYAIESLHRKLDLGSAPVFEAVATEGTGVLQTLSTISKRVIRSLRDRGPAPDSAPPPVREPAPPVRAPAPPAPEPALPMERAILEEESRPEFAEVAAEVEATLEAPSWEPLLDEPEPVRIAEPGLELRIVSVGEVERTGERSLRLPLVLQDEAGRTVELAIRLELDPLLGEES